MNVPINAKRLRATLPDVVARVRKETRFTVILSQPAGISDRAGRRRNRRIGLARRGSALSRARGQRPSNRKALAQINLHWHDLRHEALSRLADDGVPVHELQMLAGHASITTTQRYMNARANSLAESMRQPAHVARHASRRPRTNRFSGLKMTFEALPIVSHLSADTRRASQDPQNMARPAGIEPAAPRLGGGCSIR